MLSYLGGDVLMDIQILVVEDDVYISEMVQKYLQKVSFSEWIYRAVK